jgi:hypothetical protein
MPHRNALAVSHDRRSSNVNLIAAVALRFKLFDSGIN